MQAEFIPLPKRNHGADHQHPPRALVEMRPRPDLAPGVARDHVLEICVECIATTDRLVDPGIAQHFSAHVHTGIAAFLVVHAVLLLRHCQSVTAEGFLDCFAALAMTVATNVASKSPPPRR